MKTEKLTYRRCDHVGEWGMALQGVNVSNELALDTSGMVTPHDLLEHQNGLAKIGGIQDEMEAVGGILYVRGHTEYVGYESPHPFLFHLAADISRLSTYCSERFMRNTVPVTRELRRDEASVQEILARGMEDCEFESATDEQVRHFKAMALARMRIGYRKAAKRFPDRAAVSDQWFAIHQEVKDCLKLCGEGFPMEFKLQWGSGRAIISDYWD